MATLKSLRKQHPSLVSTAFSEVPKPSPPKKTTKKVARKSSKIAAMKSSDFETLVEKGETLYVLAEDGKVYQVNPETPKPPPQREEPPMQQVAKLKKRETRIRALIRQARAEANASYTNGVYQASEENASEGMCQHPLADARVHQHAYPQHGYYSVMEDDVSSSDVAENPSSQFDSLMAGGESVDEQELLAKMERDTAMLMEEEIALIERLEKEKEFLKRSKLDSIATKVRCEVEKLKLKKRRDELAMSLTAATRKKAALGVIKNVMENQQKTLEKDCKRVNQQKLEEDKFKKLLTDALDIQVEKKKHERKRRHVRRPAGRPSADSCTQTPYTWDDVRPPSTPRPSHLPTRRVASYRTAASSAPVAQDAGESKALHDSRRSLYEDLKRCRYLLGDTMERVSKYMHTVGAKDDRISEIASEISQRFTERMDSTSRSRLSSSSKASMRSKKPGEMKLPRVDTSSRVNLTAAAAKPSNEELEAKVNELKQKLSARHCTVSISKSTRNFLKNEWSKVLGETKASERTLRDIQRFARESAAVPEPVPPKECEAVAADAEKSVAVETDTQEEVSVALVPIEEAPTECEKEEVTPTVDDVPSEAEAKECPSATTLGMLSENRSFAREPQSKALDFEEDPDMCDACDSFCRPPTPPVYHAPLMKHMSRMPVSNMSLSSIREGVTSDFSKEFSSPLVERHMVPYQSLTTRFGLHLVDLPSRDDAEPTEAEEEEEEEEPPIESPLNEAPLECDASDEASQESDASEEAPQDGGALDETPLECSASDEAPLECNALDEAPVDNCGGAIEEGALGEEADQPLTADSDSAIIACEVMDSDCGDMLSAAAGPTFDSDFDGFTDSSSASAAEVLSKPLTQTASLHRAQRFSDPNVEHMAAKVSPISALTSTASTGKLVDQLSSVLSSVSLQSAPEEREIHFPHGVEEEDSLIAITVLHEPAAHKPEVPFITMNRSDPGPKKLKAALKSFASEMVNKAIQAVKVEKKAPVAVEASAAAVESREGSPAFPDEEEQPSLIGSTADLAEEAAVAVEDTATQQQTVEEVATETTPPKVSGSSVNETEGIVRTSFSRSVSRVSLKTSAALVTAAKGDASSTVAEETTPMVSRAPSAASGDGIIRTSFSRSVSRVSLKTSATLVTAAKGDASSTLVEETTPMVPSAASGDRIIRTSFSRSVSRASARSVGPEMTGQASLASVQEAVVATPKASATELTKEPSKASVKRKRKRAAKKASATAVSAEASAASVVSKKGSSGSVKEAEQASPKASATEVLSKEPSCASVVSKRSSDASVQETEQTSPKVSATEVTADASIASIEKECEASVQEAVQASPKASATEVTNEASTTSVKRKKRRKSSSASLKSKKGSAASLKEAENKGEVPTEVAKSASSLKEAEDKGEGPTEAAASVKEAVEGNGEMSAVPEMEGSGAEKETVVESTASLKEGGAEVVSEEAKTEAEVTSTATAEEEEEVKTDPLTEAETTSPAEVAATEIATQAASTASVGDKVSSAASVEEDAQVSPKVSYANVAKKFSVHSVETPSSSDASSPKVSSTEMPTTSTKASTESVRRRRRRKRGSAASLKDDASRKSSDISAPSTSSVVVPSPSTQDQPKLTMESSVTSMKREASGMLTPKVSYASIVKQISTASVTSKEDTMEVKPKASIASLSPMVEKQPSTVSLKSNASSPKYSDIAKGLSGASVTSGQKTPPTNGSAVDVVAKKASTGSVKKDKRSTASLSKAVVTDVSVDPAAPPPLSKEAMAAAQAVASARSKRSIRSSSRKSSVASVNSKQVEKPSPVPSIEITTAEYFDEPMIAKTSKSSSRSSLKKKLSRSSSRGSVKSSTVEDEEAVKPPASKVSKSSSRSSLKKSSTSSLKKAASVSATTDAVPATVTAVVTTADQAARPEETISTYASKVSQPSASSEAVKRSKSGGSTASVSSSKEPSTSKASLKSTVVSPKTSAIDALKLADLSSSSFRIRKGSKTSLKKKTTSPRMSATSVVSQKSTKEEREGPQKSSTGESSQ